MPKEDINIIKQRFFELLTVTPDLDLKEYVQELGQPINVLSRWKNQHLEQLARAQVEQQINEATQQQQEAVLVDLGKLKNKFHSAAEQLIEAIEDKASEPLLDTKDIQVLASSFSSIYGALYNKPSTTVNVQTNIQQNSLLESFKKRLKP